MIAAVVAWLFELWPANPMTLAIAAAAVVGGPVLGMVHVRTADEPRPTVQTPPVVTMTAQMPLTQRAAAARAFHNWRDSVHPAIERRDRERRANRWLRSSI